MDNQVVVATKLDLHKSGLWQMIRLDLEKQQELLANTAVQNPMPALIALYAPTYQGLQTVKQVKGRFDQDMAAITSVPRMQMYAVTNFGATYQGKCIVDAQVVDCFGKTINRNGVRIFDPAADECYVNTLARCEADPRCNTTKSPPTVRQVTRNGNTLTIDNSDGIQVGMPVRLLWPVEGVADMVKSIEGNTITFNRFNATYNSTFPGTMLPLQEGTNNVLFPTIKPSCQKKKMILPLYGRLPR